MKKPSETITFFRRVGASEFHIGKPGETMSQGNRESVLYIREDMVKKLLEDLKKDITGVINND